MAIDSGIVGFGYLLVGIAFLGLLREPYRNAEKPGSRGFAIAVVGVSLWPIGLGLAVVLPDPGLSVAAWHVRLLAASIISVGWMLVALEYTGSGWPSRRVLTAFATYLVVELVLVTTNSLHHAVTGPESTVDGATIAIEYGPWFWVQTVVNYGFIVGATVLLASEWYRSTGLRRSQAAILAVAVVPPLLANLVTILGLVSTPYDLTPFGLVGSGLILALALYRMEFLDLVPVAREVALGEMHDAVVTIDESNRVVDCNRSARALFDIPEAYVGRPAASVFETMPAADFDAVLESRDADVEVTTTIRGERRHLSVSISPVGDETTVSARVIVVRDITPLKRREESLEDREAELDALRRVLSRVLRHNIRNDLTVIRGNAELLADSVDDPVDEERAAAILDASGGLLGHSEKAREMERIVDVGAESRTYDLRRVATAAVDDVRGRYPAATIALDLDAESGRHPGHGDGFYDGTVESGDRDGDEECHDADEEAHDANEEAHDANEEAHDANEEAHDADEWTVTAGPGLETAVSYLLENAIEHNDAPKPRAWVSVDLENAEPVLSIRDDGPGIPDYELAALDTSRETPLSHGSGLGLWLVDWVVDAADATLSFETGDDGTEASLRFHQC